ncbi:MAG: mycothione reductase [Actinomycetota bacterium]|nr:mycothione reductase [Acidimicrobiaceae bacterium]MCH2620217.1 mycothione reductase [Acidimicrobiales bacterium]MEC7899191.1 mycothione reductase [Actinomycetota bacterium]|tara:strand:- start:5873 stop:7225 length:1353 start_codon:yes stop_codon:yes gene_type:complete
MPHHDLLIIGAGSGNTIIGPEHDHLDIAIAEPAEFGGTCMNRGCIPSKMLIYAADLALNAENARELGVNSSLSNVDWTGIQERIFGRIDPIAEAGLQYRKSLENVTVYRDKANFLSDKTLGISGNEVTADQIVISAGANPVVPEFKGLSDTPFHTSDSIMRITSLPKRLVIIGGGFIAIEMAHIFGAFGSEVIIILRGEEFLSEADCSIRERITEIYSDRFTVYFSEEIEHVSYNEEFVIELKKGGTLAADQLLIATGRAPNTEFLDPQKGGIECDNDGYVLTDEYLRTSSEGVWALGDVTNPLQLKHTANAEARVVAHNLLNSDNLIKIDRSVIPKAVFGNPQIATVGFTEDELLQKNIPYSKSIRSYSDTAFGWAMEDEQGFVKLLTDPSSQLLLGAHIIGYQASILIQQLVTAMSVSITVEELAKNQLYIHPALTEVVEQALLGFEE